MKKRIKNRINYTVLFLILAVLVIFTDRILTISNFRTPYYSGWLLIAMIVWIALYNIRKKLDFLPLGNSKTWLTVHIYVGLLTGVTFLVHVAMRVPNGVFEIVLALVYLGTFSSGVVGLFISRSFPARLTARGGEVLFERIPLFLHRIRSEVEQLVFSSAEKTETSSAIPDLYLNHLQSFFERPRHLVWHLLHFTQPRERLLLELRSQQRFLSADEQELAVQIAVRIRAKDDLDYHYALQGTLKLWLFIHVPLTYALLVFSVFHVLSVYAYGGMN